MDPYLTSHKLTPVNLNAYTDKLETLHKNKEQKNSIITEVAQIIFSKIKDFIRLTQLHSFSKEHYLTLLAQENTSISDERGCFNIFQKAIFEKLIAKVQTTNPSDKLTTLSQNLKEMQSCESIYIKCLLGQKNSIADKLFQKCNGLQPGESMWIDLTSASGKHAMKGRIERIEGAGEPKYIFQMSNTGAGLELNPLWHKTNREFYQTVVEWEPFEGKDILTKEFFKNILNATIDGTFPNGMQPSPKKEEDGKYGENLAGIEAVYKTLEVGLAKAKLKEVAYSRVSPYWSYAQEGPSCVPQGIWALAKVSLSSGEKISPNEYYALKTNAQLKNLKYYYKRISQGSDRSEYACQKAYEQALQLVCQLEIRQQTVPCVLKHILDDLHTKLKEKNPTSSVLTDAVKLDNNAPFTYPENKDYVYLRQAKLSPTSNGMRAKVEYTEFEGDEVKILLKKSDGEILKLPYLLYESLLTNDNAQTKANLEAFTEYIKKYKDPKEIPCNNLPALRNMILLFSSLSDDFRSIDGTLASRPKQLAMNNIAHTLFSIYYAKCSNQSNYDFKNDLELLETLDSQAATCLAFCDNVGGKFKLSGYFPGNIWFENDRSIRPHTIKASWSGYAARRQYDVCIAKRGEKSISKAFGKPKLIQQGIVKYTKAKGNELFPHSAILQLGKQSIIPFDYAEMNGIMYSCKQPDSNDENIEIVAGANGIYTSKNLPGYIYLFASILAQGNTDEKKLANLTDLVNTIASSELKNEELESIYKTASILGDYGKHLGVNLDKHPESALLQQTAAILSQALLKKCRMAQEKVIQNLENEKTDLTQAQNYLNQIKWKEEYIKREVNYYAALNPLKYVKLINAQNPLISLHNTVNKYHDITTRENYQHNLQKPTIPKK